MDARKTRHLGPGSGATHLLSGILRPRLRPDRGEDQADEDAGGDLDEAVEGDHPGRVGVGDEQDNRERNRGETIGRAIEAQDRG